MEKLNAMGNPLDRRQKAVDFEMFRDTLEEALYEEKFTNAGAKPYDYVLMFKVLVLQRMNHLSDAQTDRTMYRPYQTVSVFKTNFITVSYIILPTISQWF